MVGVGKARAGAVIVGWSGDAGLDARRGPPTGSVLRCLTHFGAAQFRFGLRAFAVAAASGNRAGGTGCVRTKDESGAEKRSGQESEPQDDVTNGGWKGRNGAHAEEFAGGAKKNHWRRRAIAMENLGSRTG